VIRAICVEAKPYEFDLFMFRDWAVLAHDEGMAAVLQAPDQDYIGYHYVLWLEAAVYAFFAGPGWQDDYLFLHVLKLPGAVADLGIVILLFFTTRRLFQQHPALTPSAAAWAARLPGVPDTASAMGLLAACLYAFNPGVIYATAYWGQVDSVPTLFMIGALSALVRRKQPLAWALLACGFILKPQAIILYPLLAIVTLREEGLKGAARGAGATLAVMVAGYAYFAVIGEIGTVFDLYRGIFTDDTTKVSTSAWNMWWPFRVYENPLPGDALVSIGGIELSYSLVSQALTGLSGGLLLAYAWRSRSPLMLFTAAAFLAFSFFMLPMKIHERYLFPYFALAAPLAVQSRGALFLYLLLTLTFASNLFGVYQVVIPSVFKDREIALICTAVNVACYAAFAVFLLRRTISGRTTDNGIPAEAGPRLPASEDDSLALAADSRR